MMIAKILAEYRMCIKLLDLLLKKMHWPCAEKGGHITSKVEAQKPRSGREGQLTDGTFNKLQNYYGVTVRENVVKLAGMKIKKIKKRKKPSMPVSCTVLPASPSLLAAQVGASTSKI